MLEKLFALKEKGSNAKTEVIAGITTFFTMVYIVFVNPSILGIAGMDTQVVFVTTCLIASAYSCSHCLKFATGLWHLFRTACVLGLVQVSVCLLL